MAINIFYSWQSDLPKGINRNFIENALAEAIKKVKKEFEIQPALRDQEITLDKDTKGVPGTPPIVDVIFNKISNCGIFVPDLTFVGSSKSDRPLPNPNVLIEYGWALKSLTYARIVPVMNTAFGEPTNETMPFDMRHLRNPLTYCLKEGAAPEERAKKKADLIKDLAEAIEVVIKSGILNDVVTDLPPEHTEIQSTTNPSTFLEPVEALGDINGQHLLLPSGQHLFLRIIPTKTVDEIKSSKAALDLIQSGKLMSMSHENFGCFYERNKYGAFAYTHINGKITTLTQLFRNRELWGVDAISIDKQILMEYAKVNFGFFPYLYFEKVFVTTLKNYLEFASKILQLPLPLRFIAGATDVKDYRMSATNEIYKNTGHKFIGKVLEKHLIYEEGEIIDYNAEASKILQPFFEYVWEECGVTKPDKV